MDSIEKLSTAITLIEEARWAGLAGLDFKKSDE